MRQVQSLALDERQAGRARLQHLSAPQPAPRWRAAILDRGMGHASIICDQRSYEITGLPLGDNPVATKSSPLMCAL